MIQSPPTLTVAFDDTLNVYQGDDRIGQIAPSQTDNDIEWAVYRATETGRIIDKRIATVSTLAAAVDLLDQR
jgi:hypothetical protein